MQNSSHGYDTAETARATVQDGPSSLPMSMPEYARYGRQMILPRFGLSCQLRLRNAKALIVGAGGLGCPALQYLAAAGVGTISIVDHDTVETSNLARQILHTDARVGMNKARSAALAARTINPHIELHPVQRSLSVANAVELIREHDIVLDCTDNVLTRYLISDAAVQCGRQVVSGAAQGTDGQLVTLHKRLKPEGDAHGPCYRCLFPKAPRPQDVTDCEDGGVLGTITGLVGTMQAAEAIKLLTGLSDNDDEEQIEQPSMTLVSLLSYPLFRTVKLRPRQSNSCRACGDVRLMGAEKAQTKIADDLTSEDYIAFCGLNSAGEQSDVEEVSAKDLHAARQRGQSDSVPIVLDVRPRVECTIAQLADTINIPFRQIDADPAGTYDSLLRAAYGQDASVYVVCRRGNDSRLACHALTAAAAEVAPSDPHQPRPLLSFVNVKGGLRAWSAEVDDRFPVY